MTNYFVNSLQETTANNVNGQNLTGTDNLYVSPTGDIVALGTGSVSAIYLDGGSTGNTVTIAGEVYCASGDAVFSQSTNLDLTLTGSAFGGVDGFNLLGASNILIGSQGVLSANSDGIFVGANAGGSAITVDGSILSADGSGLAVNAQTNITVNAGAVVSAKDCGALFFAGSAGSALFNAGTIESSHNSNNDIYIPDSNIEINNSGVLAGPVDPIDVYGANALIVNSGTIDGGDGGSIVMFGPANDTTIENSGTIDGAIQNAGSTGPMYLSNSGTIQSAGIAVTGTNSNDTVTNSGTIHGSVVMGTGTDAVTNEGKILGTVSFAGVGDTIDNSGSISGSVTLGSGDEMSNTGVVTQGISGTGEEIDNQGKISGGIHFGEDGGDQVTNTQGTISGGITLGMNDTLTNSGGTISGGITGYGSDTIVNSGTITGPISDSQPVDSLDNSGTIVGSISLQDAIATNSGLIHGNIEFTTQSAFANDGTITGSLTFEGSGDTVANDGTIHGLVTLGAGDSFVNTGAIHGNLDLGACDTLAMSTGTVAGGIVASTSDTFDFSGQFGHYQIADFAGYSNHHTGYDVIDFASDEFTGYTELQSHMAQVGNDVVITLDATDDIVLVGAKLTQLTAHDFLFT